MCEILMKYIWCHKNISEICMKPILYSNICHINVKQVKYDKLILLTFHLILNKFSQSKFKPFQNVSNIHLVLKISQSGTRISKTIKNRTYGSKENEKQTKKDGWMGSKITLFTPKVSATHLRVGHKLLVPTCHPHVIEVIRYVGTM